MQRSEKNRALFSNVFLRGIKIKESNQKINEDRINLKHSITFSYHNEKEYQHDCAIILMDINAILKHKDEKELKSHLENISIYR